MKSKNKNIIKYKSKKKNLKKNKRKIQGGCSVGNSGVYISYLYSQVITDNPTYQKVDNWLNYIGINLNRSIDNIYGVIDHTKYPGWISLDCDVPHTVRDIQNRYKNEIEKMLNLVIEAWQKIGTFSQREKEEIFNRYGDEKKKSLLSFKWWRHDLIFTRKSYNNMYRNWNFTRGDTTDYDWKSFIILVGQNFMDTDGTLSNNKFYDILSDYNKEWFVAEDGQILTL